jgi:hypothetical protein
MRILAIACLVALGCGNYSNEDLEFMSALPDGQDVSIPIRSAAVTLADEAELAHFTHQVSDGLNGLTSALLGIVDGVRSLSPTSRTPDSRTWGPFPADKHPGWQVRMIVSRDPADATQLDYQLAFHLAGGADTDWPLLLSGWFRADGTARQGTGHFAIDTAPVRAENLDPDLGMLDHMAVDYQTGGDPVTIDMDITNLADPTMPSAPTSATYAFASSSDGRRQMTFDFTANVVPGPAVETTTITSQWLDSGEGQGSLTILAGDGAGLGEKQCWNTSFIATFTQKDWAPPADGDPASCPNIPLIATTSP